MKVIEFTTVYGITYIGKELNRDNENEYFYLEDVMMVSMKPVKVDAERYNMVPALDVINVFSEHNEFKFKFTDIIYFGYVDRENFLKMYHDTINMYSDAKVKHGDMKSNEVNKDVNVQK